MVKVVESMNTETEISSRFRSLDCSGMLMLPIAGPSSWLVISSVNVVNVGEGPCESFFIKDDRRPLFSCDGCVF